MADDPKNPEAEDGAAAQADNEQANADEAVPGVDNSDNVPEVIDDSETDDNV